MYSCSQDGGRGWGEKVATGTLVQYLLNAGSQRPCSVVEGFLCHVFYLWTDFLTTLFGPRLDQDIDDTQTIFSETKPGSMDHVIGRMTVPQDSDRLGTSLNERGESPACRYTSGGMGSDVRLGAPLRVKRCIRRIPVRVDGTSGV